MDREKKQVITKKIIIPCAHILVSFLESRNPPQIDLE